MMKPIILWMILLTGLLFAEDFTRYFEYIEQDQIEKVREAIPDLVRKNPRNPDVLFLSALVEPDGDKALLIYKDVMSQYPNSNRADDALNKIIEYLYTKGLYKKTIGYSKQLIAKYPDSEQIGNCVYMMLCSFNVMNKKDSVDYYYRYYLQRYPEMDLSFFNYQSESAYLLSDTPPKPSQPAVKPPPKPVRQHSLNEQKWALQVGAFGNPQNALSLKNKLSSWGYEPYVQKIKGRNADLLSVRVGNYSSKEEADAAGERLKMLHSIDYIVIKRNSWE